MTVRAYARGEREPGQRGPRDDQLRGRGALFISPQTVEANLARPYELGIKSRPELGPRAKEIGLTVSQT